MATLNGATGGLECHWDGVGGSVILGIVDIDE